jgi:hypothetical protein
MKNTKIFFLNRINSIGKSILIIFFRNINKNPNIFIDVLIKKRNSSIHSRYNSFSDYYIHYNSKVFFVNLEPKTIVIR